MVAPHRVFGPETNDLVLQLRKRKVGKVILGGMAAPRHPGWGYGYEAALIDYAFLAGAVLRTDDVVAAMGQR